MEQIVAAIIGAVVALITFLISSWLTQRQHKRSYESRLDELFMTALNFLEGGTQKRNVGIAAISLYLQQEDSKHIQLCRELLIGAAIYLICESGEKDKTHEIYNLKRIMKLIIQHVPTDGKSHEEYQELKAVLEAWRVKSGKDNGLHLDSKLVNDWRDALGIEYDKSYTAPPNFAST